MATDSSKIHKVLTYKSGNFVFTRFYDQAKVDTNLKVFHACYSIIASLPKLPSWSAFLDKELIRKSIFSTAALEGNPLGEDEVQELIDNGDKIIAPKDFEREIINLKNAHDKYILTPKSITPFLLSEDLIKEVHYDIANGVNDQGLSPGAYRNAPAKVGNDDHGGTYIPPKILEDIKTLMKEFIAWINSNELLEIDPIIRAALSHYHLARIHPFRDGNGRTARMIEAMILASAGYQYIPSTLWNHYYINIHKYYIAFTSSEKNKGYSTQPFLDFILESLNSSLHELKDRVTFALTAILFKDYITFLRDTSHDITQRQYNLIELLMKDHKAIDHNYLKNNLPYKILYQSVSEKTVKRDLHKLESYDLLSKENNKYKINYNAIHSD